MALGAAALNNNFASRHAAALAAARRAINKNILPLSCVRRAGRLDEQAERQGDICGHVEHR